MSNKEGKSAEFSYGFVENDNELGVYGLVDGNVQRKGETLSKVRVIFSDGTEEDI